MNDTAQVTLHIMAVATLLSPFWFEMTAPPREPYTHDPKVFRRSRIGYLVALPLFLLCVTLDILTLASLPDQAGFWLALWLAIEIYWLIAFGTVFLRGPEDIGKRKKRMPNQGIRPTK